MCSGWGRTCECVKGEGRKCEYVRGGEGRVSMFGVREMCECVRVREMCECVRGEEEKYEGVKG